MTKHAKMMSIILVNLCSLSFNPFGKVTLEFRVSYSIRFRMLIIWNKGIKQDPSKSVVTNSEWSAENCLKVLTSKTLKWVMLYHLLSITLASKMANVYNYFKNLSNDNYLINSQLSRCRTAKGYSESDSKSTSFHDRDLINEWRNKNKNNSHSSNA